ncbi:OpgC domain-containing protein [uncultured Cohaesibacter sp.]|uniref:OpgC family protein n=1 Tax=uncultured Cohaesibacter sp. TaxID=1002546 RepID=UPI0029C727D0|nr:OpgC domain-containing protein [uncultured Cohaesibacter sp.]
MKKDDGVSAMSTAHGAPNAGRDIRIDVLRGLALITIFINHAPYTPWSDYTMGHFGFADAAEAFVLMSGIAAGLAYSRTFFEGSVRQASLKIWHRAGVIYSAHVMATVVVMALLLTLSLVWPLQTLIRDLNVVPFLANPVKAVAGLFSLSYQLGYFNILPLYCALLLVLPALLWIARWRLDVLLFLSAGLWLVSHLFGLYVPGWPSGARWFLNPFGWQLLFVVGLMIGIRKKQGRKLVPYNVWLYGVCVAYLAASLLWQLSGRPDFPRFELVPDFVYDMDKGNLAFVRFVHIFALAYVVAHGRMIGWLLERSFFRFFAVLGQASLTVFVTGSLLAAFLQMMRVVVPQDVALDTVLLLVGMAVQYGLARRALGAKKSRGDRLKRLSLEVPGSLSVRSFGPDAL